MELAVQPNDPCLDEQSLLATMVDYRFLPIGISGKPPFAREGLPKALRLRAGDKLTIVAELTDLERLVRRERAPADRRVLVHAFPLSARDLLMSIARTNRSCGEEEARAILAALPFVLASNLTRGGAVEMVAQLTREKVDASFE